MNDQRENDRDMDVDQQNEPDQEPAPAAAAAANVQFNPISLSSDEESESENDKNNKGKQMLDKSKLKQRAVLHENAIIDCLSLAIDSHDNDQNNPQKAWNWEGSGKDDLKEKSTDKENSKESEDQAMKIWTPQPLFLPIWAVPDLPEEDARKDSSS